MYDMFVFRRPRTLRDSLVGDKEPRICVGAAIHIDLYANTRIGIDTTHFEILQHRENMKKIPTPTSFWQYMAVIFSLVS